MNRPVTTRRSLIIGAGSLAGALQVGTAWANAQRRVGALFSVAETDPEGVARLSAFREGLAALGWIEGRNLVLDARFAAGSLDKLASGASDLLARKPDVVLAAATTALVALKTATTEVPIVFAQVTDPVGAGFIESLARPGGNITGVTQHDFSIGAKWLELLSEAVPGVARIGVLYDPKNPATEGYLKAIVAAAPALAVTVDRLEVADAASVRMAIDAMSSAAPSALIILPGPVGAVHRETILERAATYRMATVFPFRYHVVSGGLMSYGVANVQLYRQAAWHVDRILKGDRPAALPVENASTFQLVVNLRTAAALGLAIPPSILIRADEVIE